MQAIVEDVQDWKKLEKGSLEAKKAIKRMKMLYGHLNMWNEKMVEINDNSTDRVDKPMPLRDINRKEDEDFVYFWGLILCFAAKINWLVNDLSLF